MGSLRPRERWLVPLLLVTACARFGAGTAAPAPGPEDEVAGAYADAGDTGRGGEAASRAGAKARGGAGGRDPARESTSPYEEPAAAPAELPARTFRLSHAEYAESVEALVGKAIDTSELEPELDNGIYRNMSSSGLVRTDLLEEYYAKARAVTDSLDTEELAALVPGHELELAGKAGFLEARIRQAFRRPATAAELEAYGALFELAASEGDLALGFRSVLRALLSSPHFLYRTEIGGENAGDDFSLTDYEVASLLSYGLEGRPPSDELLAAAEASELTDPERLAGRVRDLVDGNRARGSLVAFATEWLELDAFEVAGTPGDPPAPEKEPKSFPGFGDVRREMHDEALGFLDEHAGFDATLAELLTTQVPDAAGALGEFYRSAPSGSSGGERYGVLSLGALLSLGAHETRGSPTLRGLFVRERLLCQEVRPPDRAPPALGSTNAEADATTTRELYAQHARQAACAGCHAALDDIGFTLESFDGAGRFRTEENGVAVDTRGDLSSTDRDRSLADHAELARALSESEWVRECVATQAFRWYFGEIEPARGAPPIQAARRALAAGTFGEALIALWSTPSTYLRRREP